MSDTHHNVFDAVNEKHQEVQIWLEQVYAGEPIPQFELNQLTITTLYDLMRKNHAKDHDTQLIINDLRQKAEEYNAEAQRLSGILTNMNLSTACLSQSGVMSLRTLANLALLLQVKDASNTSFLLALQNLHDKLSKTTEARRLDHKSLSHLLQKMKSALLKYSSLQKALQVLEEQSVHQRPEMEKRAKRVAFLQSKAKDYKIRIQQHQSELAKAGADPAIYHRTLVAKSQELQTLKEKIAPLRSKLQSYHDLPPDISQTKVKIEELKQQVAGLESELLHKIDLMHM